MEVTNQMKDIDMLFTDNSNGRSNTGRYYDENGQSKIDLVFMENQPCHGKKMYATVGLSNYDIGKIIDNKPLRIEIVGACVSGYDCFANIISTCAFYIINSGYQCYPGVIFPDVVGMYYPQVEMKHVLFTPPFLWDEALTTFNFSDKRVVWLQAIPISEEEYAYVEQYGVAALEERFEEADIDILDLERRSII
jgi:hypothetical protein